MHVEWILSRKTVLQQTHTHIILAYIYVQLYINNNSVNKKYGKYFFHIISRLSFVIFGFSWFRFHFSDMEYEGNIIENNSNSYSKNSI